MKVASGLPLRSTIKLFIPPSLRVDISFIISSYVVAEKRFIFIYPILSCRIIPTSTLYRGILSLVIANSKNSLLSLFMVMLTTVPFSPRKLSITSLFLIPVLATSLFSILIILSPDLMPNFSDGPPEIAEITTIVSFMILNCTLSH